MGDSDAVGRGEAAESSRTTRQRLEIAIEGADLGTWDWNIATGETIFNARWTRILGYELDEIRGHVDSWRQLVHPDDSPGVLAAVEAHLSGSTPFYSAEYRMRHRDGRWIWILAHGRIYRRAPDGTPLRAAGIHQDITGRKGAEEALRLSREMYKQTVELTTQIPWTASSGGAVIGIDEVWTVFTGRSLTSALEDAWLDAIHPEDRPRLQDQWKQSVDTGQPYKVAHRLRHNDGEYRHCETRAKPHRNEAGEIVRWYGTTEDIHDRTVAERLLRDSEARRKLALEGAQLATWDWNLRTGAVIRDAHWFEMLGFDKCVASDWDFWAKRIHPDDWIELNRLWNAHCQDERQPFRGEFRIRHNSGEWRWLLSHGRIVERDDQGPIRACGIHQDVTERRKFEDALASSERFSRLLLEAYQDCVALLDESGRILYLNPAGLARLGIAAADSIEGRLWIDLWREEDRARVMQAVKSAFAGQSCAFQSFCEPGHALPGWWDVLLSPVTPTAGQPARVLAVGREITRLKEQEEKQRDAIERERLQAILENLNEGIVIAAPDGEVRLMNRAAQQMYGFDPSRNQTIHCSDLYGVVDAGDSTHALSSDERPLARAVRGEAFSGVEALLRNRLNGRQWIACCGSTPVYSHSGELLLAVLSLRDVTAQRRAADEIRNANEGLHELSGELLRLQDEERRRIARELHDGTVQTLSAAAMNLTVLADSPELRTLQVESRLASKALRLLQQSVKELRTMSYLLHPPVLDELGLDAALRSWIDGFSERTGIPVDISMPHDMGRFAPEVETALFRITQEALGNIHRHARCSTAGVQLAVLGDTIGMEITDDGKGFDWSALGADGADRRFGVGLLGMRERAIQLGGSLVVGSHPGQTVVSVCLPRRPASA